MGVGVSDVSSLGETWQTSARWYVVQAQSGRENLALVHLRRQGFTAFCPSRSIVRARRGKMVEFSKPLYPGYLFARLDLAQERWRSINGTIGVLRLVGFSSSGRPAPLPWGFVEMIEQGLAVKPSASDELKIGDAVRVIGGPFDDLCGVFDTANDDDRVTILFSLLGQETRVTMSRGLLIAA